MRQRFRGVTLCPRIAWYRLDDDDPPRTARAKRASTKLLEIHRLTLRGCRRENDCGCRNFTMHSRLDRKCRSFEHVGMALEQVLDGRRIDVDAVEIIMSSARE